jgi:hypothetical protein
LAADLIRATLEETTKGGPRVKRLASAVAGAILLALLPVTAVGGEDSAPPRPYVRSHGVRLKPASGGYCPAGETCAFYDIFRRTKPLPVHRSGHVYINTRVKARKVTAYLGYDCGGKATVWKAGPRKFMFHVSKGLGTRDHCDGVNLDIWYAKGTRYHGYGSYTFSTEPHKH